MSYSNENLRCPLLGVKRTLIGSAAMSAFDPKRTLASPKWLNENYGISQWRLILLGLDVGCPDHLGPFFCFVGNELAEVGRRANQRRATQIDQPRLHLGVAKGRID